jgi:hypothetical protein
MCTSCATTPHSLRPVCQKKTKVIAISAQMGTPESEQQRMKTKVVMLQE